MKKHAEKSTYKHNQSTNAESFDVSFTSAEGTGANFAMKGDFYSEILPYGISLTNVVETAGVYSDNLIDPTLDSGNSYGPF